MGEEEQREKENNILAGALSWNCATASSDLKLLTSLLLFLFSLVTVIIFLPSHLSPSPSDLRLCLSKLPTTPQPPTPPPLDVVLPSGALKRTPTPTPYGAAAYTFILMSAYRGGLHTFSVIALSSKPLHRFSTPSYQCQWVPHNSFAPTATAAGYKILPDWGYGRVYTVVIINCTFPAPVGRDGLGGKLLLIASTNGGGDKSLNLTDTIEALVEKPNTLNPLYYTDPPKYEYLYCGSPLFGNISPQRVREWLAYHARLFGTRSHFVMYDAGGVEEAVMEVLRPWMEKGFVSLHDVREQERFDGYYHNQFLILNDCLHRYRFDAKWMFFFDVDEFIYVVNKSSIKSVTESVSDYTQFFIQQMSMASNLCLSEDKGVSDRKWGFEKLVYREVKKVRRRNRKYAVQPRNVFATGVHLTQDLVGKSTHQTEGLIEYFHYHGVLAERRDPCRQFYNATTIKVDNNPYVMDTKLRGIATTVKRFEVDTIGPRLQGMQQ
ncbi:hypothetical protein RHGRI_037008 [Rhododendron griersonianum]|uniref:Glycosyltransferase family 92 protein n=1 Tax=Rhododendron griersonianum TaxID=479676 RepID=A0AAV6HR89_9ERIC|nr:hypothetical protein RHGRI_037008 [Rhododendron griersonianum]